MLNFSKQQYCPYDYISTLCVVHWFDGKGYSDVHQHATFLILLEKSNADEHLHIPFRQTSEQRRVYIKVIVLTLYKLCVGIRTIFL